MYRQGSLSPFPYYLTLPGKMFCFPYLKASPFLAQVNHIPALPTLTSMLKMEAAYSSQNITHARFQTVTVVWLLDRHTWRHHNPLKHRAPITQWHSLTSRKAKILYMIHNYRIVYHSLYRRASPVNWSTSSSSSSCSLRVRCVPCSLVLKVESVPPSLLRSSNVPSSFWSVFQCLFW